MLCFRSSILRWFLTSGPEARSPSSATQCCVVSCLMIKSYIYWLPYVWFAFVINRKNVWSHPKHWKGSSDGVNHSWDLLSSRSQVIFIQQCASIFRLHQSGSQDLGIEHHSQTCWQPASVKLRISERLDFSSCGVLHSLRAGTNLLFKSIPLKKVSHRKKQVNAQKRHKSGLHNISDWSLSECHVHSALRCLISWMTFATHRIRSRKMFYLTCR